jgi:hypothetical protein
MPKKKTAASSTLDRRRSPRNSLSSTISTQSGADNSSIKTSGSTQDSSSSTAIGSRSEDSVRQERAATTKATPREAGLPSFSTKVTDLVRPEHVTAHTSKASSNGIKRNRDRVSLTLFLQKDLVLRLRILLEALLTDPNIEVDHNDFPLLPALATCLVQEQFLQHADKDVRLYTIQCCIEILGMVRVWNRGQISFSIFVSSHAP